MTGFDSKRKMALAKLDDDDDDDTQVYGYALTAAYQSGFADGKRSVQRQPLTDEQIVNIMPSQIPSEYDGPLMEFARAVEAAHGIGDKT